MGTILNTDALAAQYSAQDAEYAKQAAGTAAQRQQQEQQAKQPPTLQSVGMADHGHVTTSTLDSVMQFVQGFGDMLKPPAQDASAGVATAAANTVDALNPAHAMNDAQEQLLGKGNVPLRFDMPIWDHAKAAIMDFRDAVAVKDPGVTDSLLQSGAQLAVPFMAYSRALSTLHGFSNTLAAGAATDATALQPHDMRTADLVALGQQTDTKIGAVLRAFGPYGLNAYVNFLTDRGNETEAEGRFKNALDGLGANMILTPLLHSAGITVKQGMKATNFMLENGVRNTVSDLAGGFSGPAVGSPAAQSGKIVFHGTSADFDEFSDHAIGTGEGNQTFGHGHYFAENPETAGTYSQMAARRGGAAGVLMDSAAAAVKKAGGRAQAYTELSKQAAVAKDPAVRADLQKQMQLIRSGNYDRGTGKLLHVDISDEHLDNMIHWDQPVNAQPKLQKALENLEVKVVPEGSNYRVMVNGKPGSLYMDRRAALSDTDLLRGASTPTMTAANVPTLSAGQVNASVVYDQLASVLGSQKAASQFLSRRGVTGIKYLDQGSRAAGEGTNNIVLFNPKHAKIVKKE